MSRIVVGHAWNVRARRLLTGLIQPPARPLSNLHAQATGSSSLNVSISVTPGP